MSPFSISFKAHLPDSVSEAAISREIQLALSRRGASAIRYTPQGITFRTLPLGEQSATLHVENGRFLVKPEGAGLHIELYAAVPVGPLLFAPSLAALVGLLVAVLSGASVLGSLAFAVLALAVVAVFLCSLSIRGMRQVVQEACKGAAHGGA